VWTVKYVFDYEVIKRSGIKMCFLVCVCVCVWLYVCDCMCVCMCVYVCEREREGKSMFICMLLCEKDYVFVCRSKIRSIILESKKREILIAFATYRLMTGNVGGCKMCHLRYAKVSTLSIFIYNPLKVFLNKDPYSVITYLDFRVLDKQ